MKTENSNQQEIVNQSPTENKEFPNQITNSSSKNKFLVIMGIILLISGAYFLGTQYGNQSSLTQTVPSPTSTAYQPSPTPAITNTPEVLEYKTRYFNTSDMFFNGEPYPSELTSIPDSSLTPMACTSLYYSSNNDGKNFISYDEKTQKSNPLIDSSLLGDIQLLNKKYNGTVSDILSCTLKQGKTIVLYNLIHRRFGSQGTYVGVVDAESSDILDVGIMRTMGIYFGCGYPLQQTENAFYYECRGGDGGGGEALIYKLSLDNFSISIIRQCISGIDETNKPYVKCQ